MRSYRLFKLGRGGCVVEATWIDAPDDAGAAETAMKFADGFTCEIWDGDRLVGTSEPFGASTQAIPPSPTVRSPYTEERRRAI
jgi:hypothetical protein